MARILSAERYPPLELADTISQDKAIEVCKMARTIRFILGCGDEIRWDKLYLAIYAAGVADGQKERTDKHEPEIFSRSR